MSSSETGVSSLKARIAGLNGFDASSRRVGFDFDAAFALRGNAVTRRNVDVGHGNPHSFESECFEPGV